MKIQACKRFTGLDPGQVPGPHKLSEPHLSGVDELLWVDVEQFLGVLDPDAVRILLQDLGVGGRDRDSLDAAVARPARVGQAGSGSRWKETHFLSFYSFGLLWCDYNPARAFELLNPVSAFFGLVRSGVEHEKAWISFGLIKLKKQNGLKTDTSKN